MTVHVDERPVAYQEVDGRYSTIRVAELTGATYRQLDYWRRLGILEPDDATGSGSLREWSLAELQTVYYAIGLIEAGFTTRAALEVAKVIAADRVVDVTVADIVRVRVDARTEGGT